MDAAWREKRKAELDELRVTNPIRLVLLFRRLTGIDDHEPLPFGVTYASIIEVILKCECMEPGNRPRPLRPERPTFTLNDPTITLIEHLRTKPGSQAKRHTRPAPAEKPVAEELFGSIDVCSEEIDWLAAARFVR